MEEVLDLSLSNGGFNPQDNPLPLVDNNLCLSIKKKNTFIQCTRKRKDGKLFCGYHCRAKKVIRYDEWLKTQTLGVKETPCIKEEPEINFESIILNKKIKNKTKKRINIKINEPNSIAEFMIIYKRLLVKQLHKYIDNFGLQEIVRYAKRKREIISLLGIYEKTFNNCLRNFDKLIKLQSFFRMRIIRNRIDCNNDTDVCLFEPLLDIPCGSFIRVKDDDEFWYGFDITTLKECLKNSDQNPYNRRDFSQKNLIKIRNFIRSIENRGRILEIEKVILTPEKEVEMKAVSIFQKFDMLGNYTDHNWFLELTLQKLKQLYREAQDIWEYRAQIPINMRTQYLMNGKAFTIPYFYIDHIQNEQKIELQNIILTEFDRFASEGVDEETRKLSVMLMLTSLVIVSKKAADAMPQYVQNFA